MSQLLTTGFGYVGRLLKYFFYGFGFGFGFGTKYVQRS